MIKLLRTCTLRMRCCIMFVGWGEGCWQWYIRWSSVWNLVWQLSVSIHHWPTTDWYSQDNSATRPWDPRPIPTWGTNQQLTRDKTLVVMEYTSCSYHPCLRQTWVRFLSAFVCLSTQYLKNRSSEDQQTWHRHFPLWVLETHLFWHQRSRVKVTRHKTLPTWVVALLWALASSSFFHESNCFVLSFMLVHYAMHFTFRALCPVKTCSEGRKGSMVIRSNCRKAKLIN